MNKKNKKVKVEKMADGRTMITEISPPLTKKQWELLKIFKLMLSTPKPKRAKK